MRLPLLAAVLLLTACAGADTGPDRTTAAYDAAAQAYCKKKFPNMNIAGCMVHMKTGYLTNDEINFINEKTRWWDQKNES